MSGFEAKAHAGSDPKDADDPVFRSAGVVIKVANNEESIKFLRRRIVRSLIRADLRYGLVYTQDRESVLCIVYATYHRLLVQADRLNYRLPLSPTELEAADVAKNRSLQARSLVFDYEPHPNPLKRLRNVPGPPKILRGKELAIPSTRGGYLAHPWPPYAHIYAPFDLPKDDSPEEQARYQLFHRHSKPAYLPGSLLKSVDALNLMFAVLRSRDDGVGTGAFLKLERWKVKGKIENYSPLHDATRLKVVSVLATAHPWNVPVQRVRKYFGEKVGMYFGFLAHFTRWLVFPAFVGTVAFVQQLAQGTTNIAWLPALGIITTLWSTFYLESWKRQQTVFAMQWGMTNFEDMEELRPEYCRHEVTFRRRSLIHGKPVYWSSTVEATRRLVVSFSVVVVLILIVVIAVSATFVLRIVMAKQETEGNLPKGVGNYIVSIINSIEILIMNKIYGYIALRLTEYENHPTETAYNDSLITKTCLFMFVNSYFSFFYIAFIKSSGFSLFGEKQTCAVGAHGEPDCMRELAINLGVIFVSRLVVGNFTEVLLPRVIAAAKRCVGLDKSGDNATKSAAEIEVDQPVYDTFGDYLEMLILYGYMTLFVVAFPLAPLLGLLNNVVEIRVDGFKLLYNSARPIPRGAQDIGAWLGFLDILTYMSVFTNLGVVVFTDTSPLWGYESRFSKLVAFLVLEHGILLLKYLGATIVPDTPSVVKLQLQRQEYLVDKHINGIDDEVDDFEKAGQVDEDDILFHIHDPIQGKGHHHSQGSFRRRRSTKANMAGVVATEDGGGDYHALGDV